MAELKPCPFCGGEAEEEIIPVEDYKTEVCIIQCKCGCCVSKIGKNETEEAWNRRGDK